MKLKKTVFVGLAIGLLALGGWKAYLRFASAPAEAAVSQWICPMRCLNRVYGHAGECDVCHMKLKPYAEPARKLLGYNCPLNRSEQVFEKGGTCPFCGLSLRALYDGPPPPLPAHSGLRQWPLLGGKTAVYYRPYEVRKFTVEKIVRAAGPMRGRRLDLKVPDALAQGIRAGGTAMVMPPQGYYRGVYASVEKVGPGDKVQLRLSRPIPGNDWGLAELRVEFPPDLAVPNSALAEHAGQPNVFLMLGESFEPRPVTIVARGDTYTLVKGLDEGDVVAGAGLFWLESEWRMAHP